MSLFSDIYQKALGAVKNTFGEQELVSPVPKDYVPIFNVPKQEEKTNTNGGRNPNWKNWQRIAPNSFNQLLAGAKQAEQNTGVPAELLMDISGAETSGGQFLNQFGGAPGQGYFQFEPSTLKSLGSNINPYSATESAQLAAELIKKGQLSRWGTPNAKWGTLDNPNNKNGKLTDLYSASELNPYLAQRFQIQ